MGKDYLSIQIRVDQARKIAKNLYQVSGDVISLPGEKDFNFYIKSDPGSYLLKISRPEADIESIEFQHALLDHVAKNSSITNVPFAYPDQDGKLISQIRDESGNARTVRLLSWIEGRMWSSVNPISSKLLYSLGVQGGRLAKALQGFDHPKAKRKFEWDLAQADWTFEYSQVFTGKRREIVQYFQQQYRANQAEYQQLRKGIVHNDANDNNIIVSNDLREPEVESIIDYGDAVYTQIINDLAIAIAYAVMDKPDPLRVSLPVIEGYHSQFPLLEKELEFLFHLVAMRLVISVTKSAANKQKEPENEYLLISEKPAWELLEKWIQIDTNYALYSFRSACGYSASYPLTKN